MGAIVHKTLEDAMDEKIEDAKRLIRHWLNNGYSLDFAISQFNANTTFGPVSRNKVLAEFGRKYEN